MAKEEKKFEERLKELEGLVKELENGEIDLDDMIDKYTNAMKIVKECSEKLDSVTKQVNEILKENGELEEFNSSEVE